MQFATVKRVSEKRQSLNIKITPDMVPSARLLVYYVLHGEEKAELVADSVWIDVKAKCVNNLKVMPFYLLSKVVMCFMLFMNSDTVYTSLEYISGGHINSQLTV